MALGLRRAVDGALGIAAMRAALPASLALAGLLGGCSSIGGFAGAVAAAASGTLTTNPAIGLSVGVAVQAATDTVLRKVFRDMQADEQNRIAAIAGAMNVGEQETWDIHHTLPVVGESKDAPTRQWFVTQTCRQSDGQWRWAAAEPAVARWGSLQ